MTRKNEEDLGKRINAEMAATEYFSHLFRCGTREAVTQALQDDSIKNHLHWINERNTNEQNREGDTLLHLLAKNRELSTRIKQNLARLLIAKGADLKLENHAIPSVHNGVAPSEAALLGGDSEFSFFLNAYEVSEEEPAKRASREISEMTTLRKLSISNTAAGSTAAASGDKSESESQKPDDPNTEAPEHTPG